MLAYAAQGLASEAQGSSVRDYLRKALTALEGITESCASENIGDAFTKVVEHDARGARAALELVVSQPVISSQLIDNLNASIHLRALLTDLFLVDELLKLRTLV
jgi:hypothetical protein